MVRPSRINVHGQKVYEPAALTAKQEQIWEIIRSAPSGSLSVIGYGGAAGGGKSRAIVELAIELAHRYPGNRILIARKNFTNLRETTMAEFDRSCPPPFVYAKNDTEHWRDLRLNHWPEGLVSRVTFRDLKDYLTLGSAEYGAVLIDEAGEVARSSAIMLLTRLRWKLPQEGADLVEGTKVKETLTPKYVFLAASNPIPGWFEEWFVKRQLPEDQLRDLDARVSFIQALPSDNPHLPSDYEARLRLTMPADWVRRLMDGRWDAFEGQVYPQFNRDIHEYNAKLPPEEEWARVIGGLDFGGNRPDSHFSAGVVAIVLKSNRVIVVSEFEERGQNILDRQMSWMMAQEALWCNKYTGRRIQWIADRSQMAAIRLWQRMGFRVRESGGGNGSVEVGIAQVSRRLDVDDSGLPGLMYMGAAGFGMAEASTPRLKGQTKPIDAFPERMRAYRWDDQKDEMTPTKRVPLKVNDDLPDATRYMCEALESSYGNPNVVLKNQLPSYRVKPRELSFR